MLLDREQTVSGTKLQMDRAKQLNAFGVHVRLSSGCPVKESYEARGRTVYVADHVLGKIRSKTAYVKLKDSDVFIIGSANWTDATTANVESSALLVNPGASFVEAWCLQWRGIWATATDLGVAELETHRRDNRSPSRKRSSKPSEQ